MPPLKRNEEVRNMVKMSLPNYIDKYGDAEAANNLGVSRTTLWRWKHATKGMKIEIEIEDFKAIAIIQTFRTDLSLGEKLPARQPLPLTPRSEKKA